VRVAVYVGGYPPSSGGGYTFENDIFEGVLAAVARGLDHTITVLCSQENMESISRRVTGLPIEVRAVRPTRFDRLLVPIYNEFPVVRARLRGPSPLDRAANEVGADFIWFLAAGAHRTDKPFMTVVWDLQHRATPWFPELSAAGTWDRRELWHSWFLRRASVVITGTKVGVDELMRYYQIGPERIVTLPHPTPQFAVDAPGDVASGEIEQLGLGQRPFLLYPAQFWPHKNHVNLIAAVTLLRSVHGHDVDLALVGSDQGNRDFVEREAQRLGVADRVHFLGFVSRPALLQLYRKAAALAYVSWCGPENLPPLEAFALGCPVVASNIPGAEEQLGSSALLVEPGDPAAIAAALARVIENPDLRADLIARGRQRAISWTTRNFVDGAFARIGSFAPILRCWRGE
jgi:glycosyltransferase involved in cell wall biosynthesis